MYIARRRVFLYTGAYGVFPCEADCLFVVVQKTPPRGQMEPSLLPLYIVGNRASLGVYPYIYNSVRTSVVPDTSAGGEGAGTVL